MGTISCTGPWGTDSNDLSYSPSSVANAKIRLQLLGDQLLLTLLTILWVFQFQVSKVAGQSVPVTAGPHPTWENTLALAEGQVGEAAPQSAAPATLPVDQLRQFEEVIASLQANNYSTSAQYWSNSYVVVPLGSTLLVPTNAAFGRLNPVVPPGALTLDTLLSYHAILQQLSYQQITAFPVGTQFITMSTNTTILVTTAAPDDFKVDDVRLVQGNVCNSSTMVLQITCHGVDGVLNMTEWGRASLAQFAPGPAPTILPPPPAAHTPEAGSGMSPSGGARHVRRQQRWLFVFFACAFLFIHCIAKSDN